MFIIEVQVSFNKFKFRQDNRMKKEFLVFVFLIIGCSPEIGNSWGCPAVSHQALKDLKPYLKKNTLLWIYR